MEAYRRELIKQFLFEYLGLIAISVVISIVIVLSLAPYVSRLTDAPLSLTTFFKSDFFLSYTLIFIGGTLFSGLYPAIVLSSFKPAAVLKGKLAGSRTGVRMRKFLVTMQLAVSVALIAGTIIVYNQIRYILNYDTGIDIKQTLVLWASGSNGPPQHVFRNNFEAFRNDITGQPNVRPNQSKQIKCIRVDYNYIPAFNIRLLAGRNFSKSFPSDESAFILNESAARLLGYRNPLQAVGKKVLNRGKKYRIIGVIGDYNQMSLKMVPEPIVYFLSPGNGFVIIKVNTENITSTISLIKKKWQQYFTGMPFDYFFLDEFFNRHYRDDIKFSRVFTIFSVLTIFVACLGLLTLASLNAVQRTKEIGIRKAVGATFRNIMVFLSKEFLKLLLYAGIIAIPFAYYQMDKWLKNFAYRIDIQWWVFAVSWLFVSLIVQLTISYQVFKSAAADPVEALKYE